MLRCSNVVRFLPHDFLLFKLNQRTQINVEDNDRVKKSKKKCIVKISCRNGISLAFIYDSTHKARYMITLSLPGPQTTVGRCSLLNTRL